MLFKTLPAFVVSLSLVIGECGAVSAAPVSSPSALVVPNTISAGDGELSHLVFTATEPVASSLVSPVADGSGGVATPFIVSTGAGAGVELSVNGAVVPVSRLGKREIVRATGETRYTFYGVGLVPGPNAIVVTGLGASGLRFASAHYVVYGRGPAVSFKSNVIGLLQADGVTRGILRVLSIDRWNHPAMSGIGIKALLLSGDIRLGGVGGLVDSVPTVSLGSVTPTVARSVSSASSLIPEVLAASAPGGFAPQGSRTEIGTPAQGVFEGLTDADGILDIPVTPGLRSGVSVVRISSVDGATFDARISVSAYVRRAIVTGIVTGGIGAVPGDPGTDATALHESNSRRGRVALFATGKIAKATSATVAYDTSGSLDENRTSGTFDENPNSRPYLTYGDSSVRRADALSSNHLYARVNRGRSNLAYGEFQAQTADDSPGSLGGFNLLLNGAHLDYSTEGARLEAFRGSAGVSYARDVFVPTGLATVSANLHPNIVVGSDSITVVSLDRSRGFVISESTLSRNVDYVLDYGTGALRFINPPLAYDASFNPQQILVQYEYSGAGGSVVSGGRASAYLGKVRLGLGYANDATGNGNVSIFGQNVSAPVPGGMLRFEHLSTSGVLGEQIPFVGGQIASSGTSGNAMRFSAVGGVGVSRYDLVYQRTSAGFNDPFGGISSPGLSSLRLNLSRPIANGDVVVALDSERNAVGGSRSAQSDVTLRMHRKFGVRLKTTVALSRRTASSNGASAPVGFLSAGQVVNPTNLAPTPVPIVAVTVSRPTTSTTTQGEIGLTYAVSPAVEIAFDRIADLGASSGLSLSQSAQTSAQVSVLLGKAGRAYVRELVTDHPTQSFATSTAALTAASGATRVTQIGIERQIGSATTLDTQYSVQNSGSATDVYSAIGIKERVFASKTLRGDVVVQKANAVGSGVMGFTQYGATLAYDRGRNFVSTASYQVRTGASPGSTLALGAVGYVGSGFSLLGSVADSHAVGVSTSNERFGLAFRPNDDDRSAVLLGYQHIDGAGSVLGEKTNVVSLDAVDRPLRGLEATVRLAYKLDGDAYYAAHSGLVGVRLVQRVGPRLDLGGEIRASGVAGVAGSSVAGYGLEGGYRVGDGLRLALGMNFQQTPDSSLAAPPRRKGLYFTVTSVIDSLFGFGRTGR